MRTMRLFLYTGLVAAAVGWVKPAEANTYPVIVKGTVVMEDGTPPPFSVAIEKYCSNINGSAPGPITNKKGEWIWRLEIDAFATQACVFRASHAGYTSTALDASGLNTTSHDTTISLPPLIISESIPDAYAIVVSTSKIPGKAKSDFNQAMKSLDVPNFDKASRELQAAVDAAPKFAEGWHALGVVSERLKEPQKARDAYEHAIAADDKMLQAYVALTRLCLKTKDWQGAAKTADALIQADKKRLYPEVYVHQAVAQYELKNLDAALASAQEAVRLDPRHKNPRSEYVLGRILEAKGDSAGAKEHFAKYLELDSGAADIQAVRAHIANLGQTADSSEPELEPL